MLLRRFQTFIFLYEHPHTITESDLTHHSMSLVIISTALGTRQLSLELNPPLTTVFTPPLKCSTRWVMAFSGSVFSGWNYLNSFGLQNSYYARCQPSTVSGNTFSPGMCPSGQTMGFITELQNDTTQLWEGRCCPRYGFCVFNRTQVCFYFILRLVVECL